LLTRANEPKLKSQAGYAYRVVKQGKAGAPDTIRTCDLCLRRAMTRWPSQDLRDGGFPGLIQQFHSERAAKLLKRLASISPQDSEYMLTLLTVLPDFDSAIRRFDPSRPSQLILLT
jgi:hypothetical protein